MYQVFQDGKSADFHGFPLLSKSGIWKSSIFKTKREAEIYAFMWAYGYNYDESIKNAPIMELGKNYNFSMCEIPVLMMIKEVDA